MNATNLLDLRKAGQRPAGPVLATLVPEVKRYHAAIDVSPVDDLIGFHDLDVFLSFATPQLETAIRVSDALFRAQVNSLTLWALDSGKLVDVLREGLLSLTPTLPSPDMTPMVRRIRCK